MCTHAVWASFFDASHTFFLILKATITHNTTKVKEFLTGIDSCDEDVRQRLMMAIHGYYNYYWFQAASCIIVTSPLPQALMQIHPRNLMVH